MDAPALSAEDLAVDLAAALETIGRLPRILGHDRRAGAALRVVCGVAPAAIRRALAAEAEVLRLKAITEGLAARVVAQSELLSRKAERPG